ncbi:activating transcription factor of chaperone isoform X1 [Diachasma alloeum]|uniref:activating transcription factor of chaperone isoform X1 n=1 Tax=Diachasma alloeum TaxID=454923 RepID=UPI0007381E77|nr:activating transcription factor of chaperone isoform X1 [Diachasma alloeum]
MSYESWMWKVEPVSPSGTSTGDSEDDRFYTDDKSLSPSSSIISDPNDGALYGETPSRAQVATQLLEELDEYIKEEPFSDWLEEKVEFLFEEIPTPECGQKLTPPSPPKQETTQSLLQEFETVLGDVEACHQIFPTMSHLTPPQTPPHEIPEKSMGFDNQLLVALQPVMVDYQMSKPQVIPITQIPQNMVPVTPSIKSDSYLEQISGGWNAENVSLMPLSTHVSGDVANELAEMDEYVRSCAEDMSPSTPASSYTSSNSYLSSEDSNDPDWTIPTTSSSTSQGSAGNKQRGQRIHSKNRSKPYSRPNIEDKKVRKKEQNKNAATRYRQKKKAEIKEIIGEEQELVEYNEKLQDQVKELTREIGYLKGLMRDLFKAKGLMN